MKGYVIVDVHDKETRSFNMSRIKAFGTKPELQVRSICHKLGFRYRLNRSIHNTRPDLTFISRKTAIFVHGCFWHSHNCKRGRVRPKTNSDFWVNKRTKTVRRDMDQYERLMKNEWNVMIIWECELKNPQNVKAKLEKYFM